MDDSPKTRRLVFGVICLVLDPGHLVLLKNNGLKSLKSRWGEWNDPTHWNRGGISIRSTPVILSSCNSTASTKEVRGLWSRASNKTPQKMTQPLPEANSHHSHPVPFPLQWTHVRWPPHITRATGLQLNCTPLWLPLLKRTCWRWRWRRWTRCGSSDGKPCGRRWWWRRWCRAADGSAGQWTRWPRRQNTGCRETWRSDPQSCRLGEGEGRLDKSERARRNERGRVTDIYSSLYPREEQYCPLIGWLGV